MDGGWIGHEVTPEERESLFGSRAQSGALAAGVATGTRPRRLLLAVGLRLGRLLGGLLAGRPSGQRESGEVGRQSVLQR